MKREKEEAERREAEEKRRREEVEREKEEMNREKEEREKKISELEKRITQLYPPPITQLSQLTLQMNEYYMRVNGNTITHHGSTHNETCVFTKILSNVCYYHSNQIISL